MKWKNLCIHVARLVLIHSFLFWFYLTTTFWFHFFIVAEFVYFSFVSFFISYNACTHTQIQRESQKLTPATGNGHISLLYIGGMIRCSNIRHVKLSIQLILSNSNCIFYSLCLFLFLFFRFEIYYLSFLHLFYIGWMSKCKTSEKRKKNGKWMKNINMSEWVEGQCEKWSDQHEISSDEDMNLWIVNERIISFHSKMTSNYIFCCLGFVLLSFASLRGNENENWGEKWEWERNDFNQISNTQYQIQIRKEISKLWRCV